MGLTAQRLAANPNVQRFTEKFHDPIVDSTSIRFSMMAYLVGTSKSEVGYCKRYYKVLDFHGRWYLCTLV